MITYDSITKIFGKGNNTVTALDDVSFTIPKGEVVVFLGPSGCGKATTLRLTNRLETLTSGIITIEDQNIMDLDVVGFRQRLGYVIQAIGLFPNKTIAENIAVVPKLLKWDEERISKRIDELLEND